MLLLLVSLVSTLNRLGCMVHKFLVVILRSLDLTKLVSAFFARGVELCRSPFSWESQLLGTSWP